MNHLENVGYKEWGSVFFFFQMTILLLPQTLDFVCFALIYDSTLFIYWIPRWICLHFRTFYSIPLFKSVFTDKVSSNNTWKSFISLAVPLVYCYSKNHFKTSWLKTIVCCSAQFWGLPVWKVLLLVLPGATHVAAVVWQFSGGRRSRWIHAYTWKLVLAVPWDTMVRLSWIFIPCEVILGFLTSWYLSSKKASPQTQALIKSLTPPLPQNTHLLIIQPSSKTVIKRP